MVVCTCLTQIGFVVIPGVIPEEKAKQYASQAYDWMESWGLGFDRNDPSTWRTENLPFNLRGGIFGRGGMSYQQFVWDIKQDPNVIDKWEQIWGTKELVTSYDAVNISIPCPRDPNDKLLKPWPHVDQSPLATDLYSVQGLVNLLPNGPQDGGLLVLKGSKQLYEEFFRAFDHQKPEGGWPTIDRYDHTPEQNQWFIDRGCEWVKVCANPGDLVLWDSRTVHYGGLPQREAERIACYVCFKPAAFLTPEIKERRLKAWHNRDNTSHDPITFWVNPFLPPEDHPTYETAKGREQPEPKLTARGRQLVGLDEY
ncbi:hypothetical protein TREMEDRAFT_34783 [Tremella mesenterica DSM 1558]|uniref:uncharacterized protein n=1 Tax=Tremella mesenterica (strain ATCC 24925 / CBS 8224 / DSM 1558 / NBRC 9311 / NRRL Y-6157 / RJB 2259-6 / UBC 559-6) TaxID=578456 RepID=UPI00032BC127|nr:uncharacterized protein TREMEDRAFT_34783 [Tremella mesenterica DSM 1558]EIW66566.1 hypothetical protein TREMEDRAFT_34783 [Tremella mesenterica DSM 1558]